MVDYVQSFAFNISFNNVNFLFSGAPQVRAQELSDAVLSALFKYVKLIMFEQHYILLSLMVSLERMMRQRKTSNKEISLFVNGFQKHGLEVQSLLDEKPKWMDKNVSIIYIFAYCT